MPPPSTRSHGIERLRTDLRVHREVEMCINGSGKSLFDHTFREGAPSAELSFVPIHFRVDTGDRCVHVTGSDPLTDEDVTQYQHHLAAHPDHGAGFDQLVDLTGVDGLVVTVEGVKLAARLTDTWADHIGGCKLAIVTSSVVAYGMARMFSAYASQSLDIRIYKDLGEARRWLGLDEEEASA